MLQKKLYHKTSIDETEYSKKVYERKTKIDKINMLLSDGCTPEIAFQSVDMSRSTYYRLKKQYKNFGLEGLEDDSRRPLRVRSKQWTSKMENNVYHLRKKYPLFGKKKLTIMYCNEYQQSISESTLGRIIKKLVIQQKVKSARFVEGKNELRKRPFVNHAQR